MLPAFAATLKIRNKKLSQLDISTDVTNLTNATSVNLTFLTFLTSSLSDIKFIRSNLTSDINMSYVSLTLKNEIYYQYNLGVITKSKMITLWLNII